MPNALPRLAAAWRLVPLLGVALAIAHSLPALAADRPSTMIIFDGSGSMWGRLGAERQPKLILAREAVRQALARLPATARVGLSAFGHRRSSDCADVETLVAPDAVEPERIVGAIERLNPKGRGPICLALRDAAREIGTGPGQIVLIHDDNDNCQQDVCATAAELKRSYPRLSVQVVSIGMRPEDAQRLSCLARTTGGTQYEVQSAAELTRAVGESLRLSAVEAVAAPKELIAPPALAVRPDRPGLLLSASLAAGGAGLDLPMQWRVRRTGPGDDLAYQGETAAPYLQLPSGRYEVESRLGLVAARRTIDYDAAVLQKLNIPLEAGTIAVSVVSQRGGLPLSGAVFTVARPEGGAGGAATARPGEPLLVWRSPQTEVALPPGPYVVSLTFGQYRAERSIIVAAGSRGKLAITIPTGDLDLQMPRDGDAPVDDVTYQVLEDDPDAPQGRREVARSAVANPTFTLPAGTYYVVARRGTAEMRDRVTIRPGEVERRTLAIATGRLSLSSKLSGGILAPAEPLMYRIERIDAEPKELLQASRSEASFLLAPGRYRVESRYGVLNARAEREVELKAGAREEISLEHQAGLIRLRLVEATGGAPIPDVFWEIKDQSGRLVWITSQTEPHAVLQAGRYSIRAEIRDRRFDRPVSIGSGEERAVEIVAQ